MTITTTTTTNRYTGNASTTVFPYSFRILAATDLVVTKRLATTLVESTLNYPADYSVSGVGNATGGSITLTVAPATGDLLVIERSTARTQATSIRNNGSYFAETHETVFDKLTMLVQENTNSLGRTFTLPHTLDPASYNMNLPLPVAGQVPIWTTNGLTNGSISSGSVVLPGNGRDTTTLTQYLSNNYIYNVLDYDADPTGATDSTVAINAAIAAMPSTSCVLYFPAGTYKCTGINITRRGVRLVGERDGRPTQGGGTRINFVPASQANPVACIKLGTSGVANDPFSDASYATANYSGPQELYIENISFAYTGSTNTALANGIDTYGTNTVAIRDFFAGDVRLNNVWFEHFQYGFWGVQSDFDQFENVYALYCKVGAYFGPRSDQGYTRNFQALLCDTGLWRDRCHGGTDIRPNFVGCGASTTDTPLRYGSTYADDECSGHLCLNPWFEQQQGATVEAWIEFGGLVDAQPARDITIIRPHVVTNVQGTTPHAVYLARIGNGDRLLFDGLSNGGTNLLKTFKFTSASVNSRVNVRCVDDLFPTYDNTGIASPTVTAQTYGAGQTFGTSNGRMFLRRSDQASNYANDIFIGSESTRAVFVQAYNLDNTGGGANIVAFTRNWQNGTAAPTTGTWRVGDYVKNSAPAVGQPKGWYCTVAGTPGTWVSEGNL